MADVTMGTPPGVDLSGNPSRHRRETFFKLFFLAAGLSSLAITVAIIATLLGEAVSFLTGLDSLSALWTTGWFPRRGLFDIKTLLVGSLIVTGIGMVIATPLGLGAAIYLSEYANPRVRRIVKPILEILAGIPSIVIGFFCIAWINPEIVQRVDSGAGQFNLMAAGIGVGVLVTPLVASVAEDAMRAVPMSLREASYGLGARKVTTSLRVVFPAAISGVVASLILGASRAIGETMVVALAAGAFGGALYSTDPFQPGQTVTAAMASLAAGSDAVAGQGEVDPVKSLFLLGLILFIITFALNVLGERAVRRIREKY
jgi:phosphate transport system permease protein